MMSVITKQPTEFHDHTHSSVTVHKSSTVQEELEKNILDSSRYTPCSSYHKDNNIYGNYHKDKDSQSNHKDESLTEGFHEDENLSEGYNKGENLSESYHKDESLSESYHKDKNQSESCHKDENQSESCHKDENQSESCHKGENLSESHHKDENLSDSYHKDENLIESHHKDENFSKSHHKDENLSESHHKNESQSESYHKGENLSENYHEGENLGESYHKDENLIECYQKDTSKCDNQKDKNIFDIYYKDEGTCESVCKNESISQSAAISNTSETHQKHETDESHFWNTSIFNHPKAVKHNHPKPIPENCETHFKRDTQTKVVNAVSEPNLLASKQETESSLRCNSISGISDTDTQNSVSSCEVLNIPDKAFGKHIDTTLDVTEAVDNKTLRTEASRIKSLKSTSLISSQRETILKIRREEKLSDETVTEAKTIDGNICTENKSSKYSNSSERTNKPELSDESKTTPKEEKSVCKKLKKRYVDYGGFNDIFSEPLNVKEFYTSGSRQRERKLPSKFIYLSKMEKYLSNSPKRKHKKKYKSKTKHLDELTSGIKVEKEEKPDQDIRTSTEDKKDSSKIKAFSLKDGNAVMKQEIDTRKQNPHFSSSGSRALSKSSVPSSSHKSLKKSELLRDVSFHQHCLRRYYRLKSSYWNCSSRKALRLLKHKYNSIKLLFEREPIVRLKRFKLKDIIYESDIETYDRETESKQDIPKGLLPRKIAMKSEHEASSEETEIKSHVQDIGKVSGNLEQGTRWYNGTDRQKEIKTETEDLVDPRVMSLSKTLQSTNSGKVGLEKIFKNCNSKSMKNKRKENSKSHRHSAKKKEKPDWSKWKEKLKEASNKMVERKKGGLVIEKNMNKFPLGYVNTSPPSILHFRIPLKSNNKSNNEEKKAQDMKGKDDTVNTNMAEISDMQESDCTELNKKAFTETEDESKILKDINEELTLEEFETDRSITYSINGYSIEISRDSPIDAGLNENESSTKNECFDEDEMNKILYGDTLDDLSLNCHSRNIQEQFEETDAALTMTNDIIPNLCAEPATTFREGGNYSDEIDISPPVLEKSLISAGNSDTEGENLCCDHENYEEQEYKYLDAETEESVVIDDIKKNESCSGSPKHKTEVLTERGLINAVKINEMDVEYNWNEDGNDDPKIDKTAQMDLFKNSANQNDENQIFNSSQLVIENVRSLSDTKLFSENSLGKDNYWIAPEADHNINDKDNENSCSEDEGEIPKSSKESVNSLDHEDWIEQDSMEIGNPKAHQVEELHNSEINDNESKKHDNDAVGLVFKSDIDACLMDQESSDDMCSNTDLELQYSSKKSPRINKTNDFLQANKSENLLMTAVDEDKFERIEENKMVRNDIDFTSNASTIDERKKRENNEKSAAAVMEDLEKLWEEMKSKSDEVEKVPLEDTCVVKEYDNSEGINYIARKLSDVEADMEMFDDTESINFKTPKLLDDAQKEGKELINDSETCVIEDIENQIDYCISMKGNEMIEIEGYDETNGKSIVDTETGTLDVTETPEVKDEDIPSKPTDCDSRKKTEQYYSPNTRNNSLVSESSDGETEEDNESKKLGEKATTEKTFKEADQGMRSRKLEDRGHRKRKFSKDNYSGCESVQLSSDDNMEQNEERIMCDFPNHNWLFNKYNISEVKVEKEIEKDVKGKKLKKDDKDGIKQHAEIKSRRKSANSTANILPTQRKQSTTKLENVSEREHVQTTKKSMEGSFSPEHESIRIKWNKSRKRHSQSDIINFGEKTDIVVEKEGGLLDENKMNSEHLNQRDHDTVSQINKIPEKADKLDTDTFIKTNVKGLLNFSHPEDTCETAANHFTTSKSLDTNMDFLKYDKSEIRFNSEATESICLKKEQNVQPSSDISTHEFRESVISDKINENKGMLAVNFKETENLERKLFGHEIYGGDDDDDDDDDDEKLEIDETACTEVASNDEKISILKLQPDSDEQTSKAEQSKNESVVLSTSVGLCLTEAGTVKLTGEDVKELGSTIEPAISSSAVVSEPDKIVTTETTVLKSEGKFADAIVKGSVTNRFETGVLDLCAVKAEAGSISFKQRTNPPVQLVHPQVHKPPGKIKVESAGTSEVQTHVSIRTVENKEVIGTVSTTEVDSFQHQANVEVGSRPGSTSVQIKSGHDTIVNTSASCQLSTALVNSTIPPVPVTVLPTLAQLSTGCMTVTSASSNFGNGVVIPIQPFVQNPLQQGYVQTLPQLQPSIVQIHSQNINPLQQQPSPTHIQNQLIPITIYQAGNQTLISNYTYTNSSSEHMVSSQPANIIQAQPVNFNMNQTQLNTNSVGMPLCQQANTGPPPLLILPKPSDLLLNQQNNQLKFPKKEIKSFNSQLKNSQSRHKKISVEKNSKCNSFKQKAMKISLDKDSHDSVSDSIPKPSSDSEKGRKHSQHSRNSEEVDDEIKKQMEELDREIKRKEKEQDEMRRKKLELLGKMKQAKGNNKSKDSEHEFDSNDVLEIDKSGKVKTDEDRKDVSESNECENEVIERKFSETGEGNNEKKRSCKDVVLSEVVEEMNDDVFDSDTPIDLSSALKSTQIDNFSEENLSVSVSDGIISIKENINNVESSKVDSGASLETDNERAESDFDCMDDNDTVLRDNYQANKCDGINYIEDIGLVNPFTGEYEINEDVEGVEYLDLSTKQDETSHDKASVEIENSDYDKNKENAVCTEQNKDNNMKMQMDHIEVQEKLESAGKSSSISIEKSAENMLPISTCVLNSVSSLTDTNKQPLVSSSPSSMTTASTLSSTVSNMSCPMTQLSSISKSGFSESAVVPSPDTTDSLLPEKPSSVSVSISEQCNTNNNSDIEDAPLNLEIVKPSSYHGTSNSQVSVCSNRSIDKDNSIAQTNTNIESVAQSQKKLIQAITRNAVIKTKPKVAAKNYTCVSGEDIDRVNVQRKEIQVTDTQVPKLQVAEDMSVPQKQMCSPSLPARSRQSSLRKVMHFQDQQVLRQTMGVSNSVEGNQLMVNKQNHHSRGQFPRRIREKYMEIKPAHYKSPPRKIQKGAKPLPAHNQKPTSRETMKKMCRNPFIHPHVTHKTSPYVCKKHPIFLSPKEVEKPFPRIWEKKPPKPAHNKRPFGIAGHLIVQSSRMYRKRTVSGEVASSSRFYSLPNTPTSATAVPPRATSVDFHSSYSPSHSTSEAQGQVNSTPTSASPKGTGDHHGAQVGLPSPIRAHCRPKPHMSGSQFYETSVLRPPALLRNTKPQGEKPQNETVEVIDLTADTSPSVRPDSAPKPAESPKSKERAIQKELSHAVSKRQRLESSETSTNERVNYSKQNAALRQQQLLGQIVARQRLMPPPPYTGRQRMPVLVQVPRRPSLEHQQQRMPYDRRIDTRFDDSQRLVAQNMGQQDIQRFQKSPEMMQVNDPQIRPQMWPSQYVGPTQDSRAYGARAPQTGVHPQDLSSGNERLIQNQDQGHQQMMYPPRGTMQTAGNPRMQHLNIDTVNNITQQGYPIRGQSMPYTTTQNQTQIHQLLQQPRASSQMMQRGDASSQMMHRGQLSPQMMQRGEISPQMMQRGEINPQMMQRGEISPQMMQRGEISPQMMQRRETSPQMMQRRETSPQMIQRGNISPQMMQRRETNPQMMQRGVTSAQMIMNGSPQIMQRGMSTQMMQNASTNISVMQPPNVQIMPNGEFNQKVHYSTGNGPQMMHAGNTSPQIISPTGMLAPSQMAQNASVANGFQRSPMQSANQMTGQPQAVQSSITPEQRFQRMQLIRAQHIRSQQLQIRGPQGGFEQGPRMMQDTRIPHVSMDQGVPHVNSSIGPQQMTGYNTGIHESTGPKGPCLQSSTYPPQMTALEPQMQRGVHPGQGQMGPNFGNTAPPLYPAAGAGTQHMMSSSTQHQTHLNQNGMQNNMNTVQQNNFMQRPSLYNTNQNIQVSPTKTVPSVINGSQFVPNVQGQGHMTQMPSMSSGRQVQGQGQYYSQAPANMTVVPRGPIIQDQTLNNTSNVVHNFHQNKTSQVPNQNWRAQPQTSEQLQSSIVNKQRQVELTQQQNTVQLQAVASINNGNNVLLIDGSCQQNINKTNNLAVVIVTDAQPSKVNPHSQQSVVAMTTNQLGVIPMTTNQVGVIPLDITTNPIPQAAANNTQVSPSSSQGQSEVQGESEVKDESELPHLQQVHGECVMCGKYSLYLCSNCKKIWYCSPECQLTHWQTHAIECEGQTD